MPGCCVNQLLNGRGAVFCAACFYQQVRQNRYPAARVRVAAKDRHFPGGMRTHLFQQNIPDSPAGKMREPIICGGFPGMTAGRFERRDMGQNKHRR